MSRLEVAAGVEIARAWRAVSIRQRWADLVVRGLKPIENRTWSTTWRGALAIHASQSRADLERSGWEAAGLQGDDADLVFGAIIGVATLVDSVTLEQLPPALRRHRFAEGPICWIVAAPVKLPRPIPWPGKLGLWTFPLDIARQIDDQLHEVGCP